MSTPPIASCRCCGATLQGTWCQDCGQGHAHVRLSLRDLTDEAFEGLLAFDTRLIRTVRGLIRDPGGVVLDYLSCRRVPYMHPFKYALLMATVCFLVQGWLLQLRGPFESEQHARRDESVVQSSHRSRLTAARRTRPVDASGRRQPGGARRAGHAHVSPGDRHATGVISLSAVAPRT